MFLKLEYSELKSCLVFSGAESLEELPKPLCLLPVPKASILSLLSDIRNVALSGEPAEFNGCGYHAYISRGTVVPSSDDSLSICIAASDGTGKVDSIKLKQTLVIKVLDNLGKVNEDLDEKENNKLVAALLKCGLL